MPALLHSRSQKNQLLSLRDSWEETDNGICSGLFWDEPPITTQDSFLIFFLFLTFTQKHHGEVLR